MAKAESDKKKVRRLKVGQTLTLRQEIEKQHAVADQKPAKTNRSNKRRSAFWQKVSQPFVWLRRKVRPLAKPFRFLKRPLRGLKKVLGFGYFASSWQELRQVTWPGRRKTWQLTSAVIIFALIFGLLLAGVDKGLDLIFKYILTD